MQIKSGAVRIAQLYMQRVASELDLLSSISEKEPLLQFLLLQGVQFAFRVHQVSNFSSLISAMSDIEVSSFVFPHLWVHCYGSFEPSPVFVVRNSRSKTVFGNCLHLAGWCKSCLSLMWLQAWLISELHCMFKMTKYLHFGLLFGCSLLEDLMMTVWQLLMHSAIEHILAITLRLKSQFLIDFSKIKSYYGRHPTGRMSEKKFNPLPITS